MKFCEIEGCHRPSAARGLCTLHYLRLLRGRSLDAPVSPRSTKDFDVICKAKGCEEKIGSGGQGYCKFHYDRWRCGVDVDLPRLKRHHECRICGGKHHAKGLCLTCYGRRPDRVQNRNPTPRVVRTGCEEEGCLRKHHAKGLCYRHYMAKRKIKLKKTEKLSKVDRIRQFLEHPTNKEKEADSLESKT